MQRVAGLVSINWSHHQQDGIIYQEIYKSLVITLLIEQQNLTLSPENFNLLKGVRKSGPTRFI